LAPTTTTTTTAPPFDCILSGTAVVNYPTTTTTTTTVSPFGTFSVYNTTGNTVTGTWQIFYESVPRSDISAGFATIPNNGVVQLPMNSNFLPTTGGKFVIRFQGTGIGTFSKASLGGGSLIGPVNFTYAAPPVYVATLNAAPGQIQYSYAITVST
jgi:hypothetical protein